MTGIEAGVRRASPVQESCGRVMATSTSSGMAVADWSEVIVT